MKNKKNNKIQKRKIFKYFSFALVIAVIIYSLSISGILKGDALSGFKFLSSRFFALGNYLNKEEKEGDVSSKDLRSRINQLMVENARLKSTYEENIKLRNFLDFSKEKEYKHKIANVISPGFDMHNKIRTSLIIDKGKNDGIVSGLAVVNDDGLLVGKVSDVKSETSKVVLVTNNNCRLAVTVEGKDSTSGVLEGNLGLTINMDFIPQSAQIDKGQLVITSGLEKNIKKGLLVGKIIEIDQDNSQMWLQGVVEPIVDLDQLSLLSVLIPNKHQDPKTKDQK